MEMEKVIHHKVKFTREDIHRSLIAFLEQKQMPFPNGTSDGKIQFTREGAELSWQELVSD
ncbi:MAG TPA: hypothetical protein VMT89_01960 [Candidatus Acidoferrales bacterium]|nr:hypothetical protein [Candidatus Acidoferrales bacterium]